MNGEKRSQPKATTRRTFLKQGAKASGVLAAGPLLDAVTAAGKVHTDMARGFIRAEVVPFETLRAAGSWNAAKDAGEHRLEGRGYRVQDGDCVIFRFGV